MDRGFSGTLANVPPDDAAGPGVLPAPQGREGSKHQPLSPRSLWRWEPWTVGAR